MSKMTFQEFHAQVQQLAQDLGMKAFKCTPLPTGFYARGNDVLISYFTRGETGMWTVGFCGKAAVKETLLAAWQSCFDSVRVND